VGCREPPGQVMRITKGNLVLLWHGRLARDHAQGARATLKSKGSLVFAVRRAKFLMTQLMAKINKDPEASSLLNRMLSSGWIPNLKFLKRIVIAIVGFTVLLLGVVMIILPGPAFIIIPLGLAILATEFVWAERLLTKAKAYFEKQRKRVADKMRGKK
jgi:uncharacterized protein (TIGR02611 family)